MRGLSHLLAGIRQFKTEIYPRHAELYRSLARSQAPQTLMVTCSDSRLDPHLITQALPGELFVLRNAGNIVPPHGATTGGEEATIEFAIEKLGVHRVIVCGHTNCGAMSALLGQVDVSDLVEVKQWLVHAEPLKRELFARHAELQGEALLHAAVERNTLVQLGHVRTHPSVARRLQAGDLQLYAWVFDIEAGDILGYDPDLDQFVSLGDRADPELAALHDLAHTPRLTHTAR